MASTASLSIFLLFLAAAIWSSDQCGPGTNFKTAQIWETEPAGFVLMNVTKVNGTSWSITLKQAANYPEGSELYRWLNNAVLINNNAMPGFHLFQLNYTLDLEYVYQKWGVEFSVLSYSVICQSENPDVNYEWFVEVQAVNEFAPEFVGAPFNISLREDAALRTVAIRLRDNATDMDVVTSSPSDIHEFNMVILPLPWNMSGLFSMEDKQNGEVQVAQTLDFESFPSPEEAYLEFNITVWDLSRWNSTSTLTINILDVDDQPPYFYYPDCGPAPCEFIYTCEVASTFTGVVTSIEPDNITAIDGDTLDYNVTYQIRSVSGLPSTSFNQYVSIDSETGEFSILSLQGVTSHQLLAVIRAQEVSQKALSKDSPLIIRIIHPEQTTPADSTSTSTAAGGTTTTDSLNAGESKEGGSSDSSMVVAVVVLAVFVLFALVGLAILVLYMKKRPDKPIYPVSNLKEIEEEEEEAGPHEKRVGGTEGSRTDSGQWSMSGMPSPGPHAGSSAPAHTRLVALGSQSGGHLANGHVTGQPGRRSQQQGSISHITVAEENLVEEEMTGDDSSERGRGHGGGVGSHSPVFTRSFVHSADSPSVHGESDRHVSEAGSPLTMDVEGMEDEEGGGMENGGGGPLILQARRLPPLLNHPPPLANGATPNKRSRGSRKQRRDQMQARLREEVYDGTKMFAAPANDSFYTDGRKQKVKMSSRRKKRAQHLGHLLTVDNDYTEV